MNVYFCALPSLGGKQPWMCLERCSEHGVCLCSCAFLFCNKAVICRRAFPRQTETLDDQSYANTGPALPGSLFPSLSGCLWCPAPHPPHPTNPSAFAATFGKLRLEHLSFPLFRFSHPICLLNPLSAFVSLCPHSRPFLTPFLN